VVHDDADTPYDAVGIGHKPADPAAPTPADKPACVAEMVALLLSPTAG
jgi:hypothetical protein